MLGPVAVAAIGLSNSTSLILTLLYSAIGTGSGVFIAQAYGRGDMDEVSKIEVVGQTAASLLGACTGLPLILFPVPILRFLGAQEDVVGTAAGYLQLFAASAPMNVMSAITAAAFRAMGDSRTPMAITVGAVLLNTLLAFVLVLGVGPFPKIGVLGAGLATLTSQTIRCLVLLIVLYSCKKKIKWQWPGLSVVKGIARPLLQVTYPIALSEMLWGTSTFVYTIIFARIDTDALPSSQIVTTIETIFVVAASGLAPAAVATVGQAFGDDSFQNASSQAKRVLHSGLGFGFALSAALIGVSFLLPVFYPRVGESVLRMAGWGIAIVCVRPRPQSTLS